MPCSQSTLHGEFALRTVFWRVSLSSWNIRYVANSPPPALNSNLECHYSLKAKIGKPRGSMNKKTIERLRQGKESMEKHDLTIHTPPPTSDSTPAIPPLPSCDEDSVFSPLPSPSNVGITLDSQGSSTFNPESLPFQELISPESGLGCMEDWLPTIPGESIDNVH